MYQRRTKKTPLETLLYEIDMFRYCARMVAPKKARVEGSPEGALEYYLTLEGFLLHLRNLLAFFTNRKMEATTDLGIKGPEQWAGRAIDPREYSDLIKRTKELDGRHGTSTATCYDQISKFLQHCTTYRHEQDRTWDVDRIAADFEPILRDFEQRFAPPSETVTVIDTAGHSTASMRRFVSFSIPRASDGSE